MRVSAHDALRSQPPAPVPTWRAATRSAAPRPRCPSTASWPRSPPTPSSSGGGWRPPSASGGGRRLERLAGTWGRLEKGMVEMAIQLHTPLFYATCALGGLLSTGLTHVAVTPLDLVKCNMQVDPSKYRDISSGFGVLLQGQGLGGLFKGWMATLVGYSSQGACKFGFYEFLKKCYSDISGPENAEKLKTLIYLAASASAEVIADVALCPMEATQSGFAWCLTDGLPKLVQSEGAFGLYKGLLPLWGRQVPYTMMKFACFES